MSVRNAILYKKTLDTLIQESDIDDQECSYLTAQAPPSAYPPRSLCSVCGYWAKYTCMKCALRYCGLACRADHDERLCERRL